MKLVRPSALVLIAGAFASQARPAQAPSDPHLVVREIEARTSVVRQTADSLSVIDHDPRASVTAQSTRLMEISYQMNAIDRDLRFLDAHKESLAPWEIQAIAQSAPWMAEAARNTNAAIEALKSGSPHLAMARDYLTDVDNIFADSTKAQHVLHDYFKLESAREKVHRVNQDLGF